MRRTHKFGIERFPGQEGIMDAKDLREKADGLADIAAQVDCWLSDVPNRCPTGLRPRTEQI